MASINVAYLNKDSQLTCTPYMDWDIVNTKKQAAVAIRNTSLLNSVW